MWCTRDGDQAWRPGMAAGARDVGTGVQALEDLADGRPLVDEPAIKGAHQRGLFLVHDEVAWHRLLARHVAITVRRTAALVVAVARLLQLATAEALAENGPRHRRARRPGARRGRAGRAGCRCSPRRGRRSRR